MKQCEIAFSSMPNHEDDPEFFLPVADLDALYDFMATERVDVDKVRFNIFDLHLTANAFLSRIRTADEYTLNYWEMEGMLKNV